MRYRSTVNIHGMTRTRPLNYRYSINRSKKVMTKHTIMAQKAAERHGCVLFVCCEWFGLNFFCMRVFLAFSLHYLQIEYNEKPRGGGDTVNMVTIEN